jgi:hypothetical protein
MNRISNEVFSDFANQRNLISIRREHLDSNSIQGFILGLSDELLLLQYVYDFNLDGLLVIRKADITDVNCRATDAFQKQLLITEGLFQQIPFGKCYNLEDWKSIISQLWRQFKFVIVEDEHGETKEFLIGEVQKITKKGISLRYFSGAGNWNEELKKLLFSRITSCQVNTNYLNVYQRYFERTE